MARLPVVFHAAYARVDWIKYDARGNAQRLKRGSNRALEIQALLLLATWSVALLAAGCSQSNPVGVYTYTRAGVALPQNAPDAGEAVTFILELRANGSYVSTIENAIRERYKGAETDLPTGRGTWQVQDGTVVLTSDGREVGRLLVEGQDLIHVNGMRYTRIPWLSSGVTLERRLLHVSWNARPLEDS